MRRLLCVYVEAVMFEVPELEKSSSRSHDVSVISQKLRMGMRRSYRTCIMIFY